MPSDFRDAAPLAAPPFETPEAAERAFYAAFEAADLDAMMATWADADDIVCVHPLGTPVQGIAGVTESWREIFAGGVATRFTLEPMQAFANDTLAIHLVTEHIAVPTGARVAPIVATNVYRRIDGGWRMVQHHASPAPGVAAGAPRTALH